MREITERRHTLGSTEIVYRIDSRGTTELLLVPVEALDAIVEHRATLLPDPALDHLPWRDRVAPVALDSLVQISLVGHPSPGGFAQGRTMRGGPATTNLIFDSQELREGEIGTRLIHPDGWFVEHHLAPAGGASFRSWTTITNDTPQPITLEMLSSFSLGGITPFDSGQATGRLFLHRFRSTWSAEGRHECSSLESLNLERSWIGHGANCERFGQVGSMPVRGFFPVAAIEDRTAGVVWGAAIEWAGSWQIEAYRKDDRLALSGGLADRELGHWTKRLEPGESFATPKAVVAVVCGDIDDLCDALLVAQRPAAAVTPAPERDLPVVFNEWCTTWGTPSHANLLEIADRIAPLGVRYLVIDAGWYQRAGSDWGNGQGDWIASRELFPDGIEATAAAIRERGLIPGLWFEMEVVGSSADSYTKTDLLLSRDGVPLTVGGRRFWDLRNSEAVELLAERVIGLLERAGFGYLKVDYNETLGIGVDGAESPGEGLRQQIEAIYAFFRLIRARLPELVIENCSSGGHRLEPSMLALTDMGSFSDAHESLEIPIIAANLHRLILPAQSQIWAVLHADDSPRRTRYLLTSGLLGRLCLSGEIWNLGETAMRMVSEAIDFYAAASPIIRSGRSRIFRSIGESYREPVGHQCVVQRLGDRFLIVAHVFDGPAKRSFAVDLGGGTGDGGYRVISALSGSELSLRIAGGRLIFDCSEPFSGAAFLVERA
jgi:alpha-galactosidase